MSDSRTLERLGEFEDHIRYALETYSSISDGRVAFDVAAAIELQPTPEAGYTASSKSPVSHLGDVAASLEVVVLGPIDGTGDNDTYNVLRTRHKGLPFAAKIIPVPKDCHTEVHLTLAAARTIGNNHEPVTFAGSVSQLGLNGNEVIRLARLGESTAEHMGSMHRQRGAVPIATIAVGYGGGTTGDERVRFGDPSALYNDWGHIQVFGRLTISHEAAKEHINMLRHLGVREPR